MFWFRLCDLDYSNFLGAMAVITDSWCVGITNGKMITYHCCLLNLVYNRFLILAFSFFISCIFAWWNILEQFVLSITEATWSRTLRTPGNPGRAQSSARFIWFCEFTGQEARANSTPPVPGGLGAPTAVGQARSLTLALPQDMRGSCVSQAKRWRSPPHPPPPFPALRRLLLQVLVLRKGRPVLIASPELLGNRLRGGGST